MTYWKPSKSSPTKSLRKDSFHESDPGNSSCNISSIGDLECRSDLEKGIIETVEIDFEHNIVNINEEYAGELVRFEEKYNGRGTLIEYIAQGTGNKYIDGQKQQLVFVHE